VSRSIVVWSVTKELRARPIGGLRVWYSQSSAERAPGGTSVEGAVGGGLGGTAGAAGQRSAPAEGGAPALGGLAVPSPLGDTAGGVWSADG
jgi:hypothetical protein